MKKLTKSSLAQMAALLPELDAEDQRCILGGTATTTIPPGYTGTVPEPTTTVQATIDPYAVTGSMPTATTSMPTATSTTTVASTGSYTFEEMNQMMDNGTWNGGVVEGMGYVGGIAMITGYISTSVMDSSSSASSNFPEWMENAAQFIGEHVEPYMGVEGGITAGQNFAFQFRDGFGASISPNYIYILEGGLNSRDVGHGSIAEKRGSDFGVSYIAGVYFKSVTDGNQTQYSVGGGVFGCLGASYTWDSQGNHSVYVGMDLSGKIAACFGAEAEFKAGFFSNGKNYLF